MRHIVANVLKFMKFLRYNNTVENYIKVIINFKVNVSKNCEKLIEICLIFFEL